VPISRTSTAWVQIPAAGYLHGLEKGKALIATARRIAILYYNMLRYGMAFKEPGFAYPAGITKEKTRACPGKACKSAWLNNVATDESGRDL